MDIAVCDDNYKYIENTLSPLLFQAVKNCGVIAAATYYTDGNRLITDYENGRRYDLVILDIDMPTVNGKAVAQRLRVMDSGFVLVFVTSFRMEVFNTIPYQINGFIPKDSDESVILSELERIVSFCRQNHREYLLFEVEENGEKSTVKVLAEDIFCFWCVRRTVYMKAGTRTYQLAEKHISALVERFCGNGFFEVCRGYIANISKIRSVNTMDVELDDGEKLPLSRRRSAELLRRITEFVTERSEL